MNTQILRWPSDFPGKHDRYPLQHLAGDVKSDESSCAETHQLTEADWHKLNETNGEL